MATIYVPTEYVDNCNEINDGFIRSYTSNDRSQWVDIYPDMNYALKQGSGQISLVTCDTLNTYTDDIYYRFDLTDILITFSLLGIIMFGCPIILLTRLFKRFSLFH